MEEKKKVVFVTHRLGGGGSERVLTIVANGMKRLGHHVTIVSFTPSRQAYQTECEVVELGYAKRVNQIASLRSTLRRLQPDTVIAFEYFVGIKTVLATRGLPCKVIVSERNDPHKLDSQPLKKHARNLAYLLADVLVCQTEDAKAFFSESIQKSTVIIMNPLKENLPAWDASRTTKTIINFCRLEKQKNIPLLIEAFERVHAAYPEYALAIYGEGKEKESIEAFIQEKELTEVISLHPFSKEIHHIAAQCALFVSSSDFEGLSNSMIEAMAMGMPVICTDCPIGGARMMIEDGQNGMLVPVRNVDRLAQAMMALIEDGEKAERLGSQAFAIREQLSSNQIVKKWENLI